MYKRLKITDRDSEMHTILVNNLKDYNSILQTKYFNQAKTKYNILLSIRLYFILSQFILSNNYWHTVLWILFF